MPTVLGAITISYNVPGVDTGLKLDGKTIAGIFNGKITKWNDPAIACAELRSRLCRVPTSRPATARTRRVRRRDFTTYVAIYDSTWEKTIGVDKTVKWPGGTGAKGNDGVAACVKQNDGAVGYVEQAYALQNKFDTAAVKNKSGALHRADARVHERCGRGRDGRSPTTRSTRSTRANPKAYPITATTYLLMWQDACKAGQSKDNAKNLQTFASFALGEGQAVAKQLQYAPLPDNDQAAGAEVGRRPAVQRCRGLDR